jgi:hypothetical protein
MISTRVQGIALVVIMLASLLLLESAGQTASQPPQADNSPGAASAQSSTAIDPKVLSELALEHSRTRDALLATEARLMLLSEKLFSSRLVVRCRSEIDTPIQLQSLELLVDGEIAYRQEFTKAPTVMSLTLFDGYLTPGRHSLEIKAYARGPNEPADSQPGYSAGSGLTVHLRNRATTDAVFDVEGDGDIPGKEDLKRADPEGTWKIVIRSRFETKPR